MIDGSSKMPGLIRTNPAMATVVFVVAEPLRYCVYVPGGAENRTPTGQEVRVAHREKSFREKSLPYHLSPQRSKLTHTLEVCMQTRRPGMTNFFLNSPNITETTIDVEGKLTYGDGCIPRFHEIHVHRNQEYTNSLNLHVSKHTTTTRTYRDGDDQDPVLLVRVDDFCLHLRLSELVRRGGLSSRVLSRLYLVHLGIKYPPAHERKQYVWCNNMRLL